MAGSRQAGWQMLAVIGLAFFFLTASPLPAIAIRHIGVRWTMVAGALLLGAGFLLASVAFGIADFYVGICVMGCGFSLMAPVPVPGMYVLPRLYGAHAPRFIGFYFMAGSCCGVVGPILVNASVAWTESWRLHWVLMVGTAALLALLCAGAAFDRTRSFSSTFLIVGALFVIATISTLSIRRTAPVEACPT